jgi:hypothetical protein
MQVGTRNFSFASFLFLSLFLTTAGAHANVSSRDCRVYYEYANDLGIPDSQALSPWTSHHYSLEMISSAAPKKSPYEEHAEVYASIDSFLKERIRPDQFQASISLTKDKWDNGQWCFNGQCKCTVSVFMSDAAGNAVASQQKSWVSTTQCSEAKDLISAMTQQVPDCSRTEGAVTASALQKTKTLNQELCQGNHTPNMDALLTDPEADPNFQATDGKIPYEGRVTGDSTLACSLYYGQDEHIFSKLLQRTDLQLDRRTIYRPGYDWWGESLLANAVRGGFKAEIPALLAKYASGEINELNWGMNEPILIALDVHNRNSGIAELLLARPDLKLPIFTNGRLIESAVYEKNWSLLSALLPRPEIDLKESIYSIMAGAPSDLATEALLLPRVDLNALETAWPSYNVGCLQEGKVAAYTPLIWSVWYGRKDLVQTILSRKGVNVGFQSDCGQTALSLATAFGESDVVSLLKGYQQ